MELPEGVSINIYKLLSGKEKTLIPTETFKKEDLFGKESIQFEYIHKEVVHAHVKIRGYTSNSIGRTLLSKLINKEALESFCEYVNYDLTDKDKYIQGGFSTYAFLIEFYNRHIFEKLPIPKYKAAVTPVNLEGTLDKYPYMNRASKDLIKYIEAFLNEKGFDMCILEADNLSLAYKVYSDYYPMWRIDDGRIQIDGNGNPLIDSDKSFKGKNPDKNRHCDETNGPMMFKLLSGKSPKYDWKIVCRKCNVSDDSFQKSCVARGMAGGRRTRLKRKSKKTRRLRK